MSGISVPNSVLPCFPSCSDDGAGDADDGVADDGDADADDDGADDAGVDLLWGVCGEGEVVCRDDGRAARAHQQA